MKLLGRTKGSVYYGRPLGGGKKVRVVMYARRRPSKTAGEFTGPPYWLGEFKDWEGARNFVASRGAELV